MVPTVYIFVSGGNVQEVRSDCPVSVKLVDYDVHEARTAVLQSEDDFVREQTGKTYDEICASTKGVF